MSAEPRAGAAGAAEFELQIEELILHGFWPADRYAIAAAIERELGRLFEAGGVPPALLPGGGAAAGFESHRLDAGSFDVPHDATPDAVGVQVARAIHSGLQGALGVERQDAQPARAPAPRGVGR
jgi:hypothetical protein